MDPTVFAPDFQARVRYSLQAASQSPHNMTALSTTGIDGKPPQQIDRFHKLIGGIQFSKQFILSYQAVLVVLLLLFTTIHWGSRLQAWRRRRRRRAINGQIRRGESNLDKVVEVKNAEIGGASSEASSSSSTIHEAVFPKQLDLGRIQDEQSPLLPKPTTVKIKSRAWPSRKIIKASLVYQPQPIPFINKALPSNGTSLAILVFVALQVFYVFYKLPLSIPLVFVFADRTSLVFIANLPLIYLFAVKNQPIKQLTGFSYESLNILHRRLGEVMCLLALLHSAGMVGVWYTVLRPTAMTLAHFLLIRMILLGIGAFVAYEVLYLTSLGCFRQRWYELFLGLHVVL